MASSYFCQHVRFRDTVPLEQGGTEMISISMTPEQKIELQEKRVLASLSYSIHPLMLGMLRQGQAGRADVKAVAKWLQTALEWRDLETIEKAESLTDLTREAWTICPGLASDSLLGFIAFGEGFPREEIKAFIAAA